MAENGKLTDRDPKTGQFIEGNPGGGRPVGQRNYATIYREALTKLAEANNMTPDALEVDLLSKAIVQARKGDYRFYQDIIDRLHGKPVNRNENLNANVDMNNLLTDEEREKIKKLLNANPQS